MEEVPPLRVRWKCRVSVGGGAGVAVGVGSKTIGGGYQERGEEQEGEPHVGATFGDRALIQRRETIFIRFVLERSPF